MALPIGAITADQVRFYKGIGLTDQQIAQLQAQAPKLTYEQDPVGTLIDELRHQAGVPVRMPFQVAPSWWARPFNFAFVRQLVPGDGEISTGVLFNPTSTFGAGASNVVLDTPVAAELVPPGYLVFINRAECSVGQVTNLGLAFNHARECSWSLSVNGFAVEGFKNTICSGSSMQWNNAAPGASFFNPLETKNVLPCFVRVPPNGFINVSVFCSNGAVTVSAVVLVQGYVIPVGAFGGGDGPQTIETVD